MRNPKKISGTIFLRSIQKTEYGLAQVTLDGQKKMIPFLLTGLGKDVVDGARFKGVLISQNCAGFPSDVITNVDITRKPRKGKKKKPSGVKFSSTSRSRSVNGKDKGTITSVGGEEKIVVQDGTSSRFVFYNPGYWYVGEEITFTPTQNIDPTSGLFVANNPVPVNER